MDATSPTAAVNAPGTDAPVRVGRKHPALLSLLGGLVTTASIPPFGWWPLAFVGVALLSVALRSAEGVRARSRAGRGFAFGVGLYVPSLWWMTQFSLPGGIFVGVLEAAFTAIGLLLVPRRRAHVFVPVGVVMADSLRSLWPFGGLPLGGIDLGQAAGPLARTVAFGGRLLLIGIVAVIGVLLAEAVRAVRSRGGAGVRNLVPLALVAALVLAVIVGAHVLPDGTRADGRVIRLAIVQGGGPQGERATDATAQRTFDAHLAATATLRKEDRIDVVLWPENTVALHDRNLDDPRLVALRREAQRLAAPIMVGATEDIDEHFAKNEQLVIEPSIGPAAVFEKVRRVPYGEYFPFRSVIGKLATIPKRDFRPGSGPGILDAAGVRFAVAISYEGFFDDRSRGGVRAGGRALLVPTNASSYTTTQVPTQETAAVQLRALETGRWTAQAAPTGISAVVTPRGAVTWRSTIGARQTHVVAIPLRSGLTPYARCNDVPALLLVALAGGFGWLQPVVGRRFRAFARESREAH